jgi:hypothetical protein
MYEPKLGGRVIVFGPKFDGAGCAAIVTGVEPVAEEKPRIVSVAAWPKGSPVAECLEYVPCFGEMPDLFAANRYFCVPAAPEPMAVEMNMQAFTKAIEPMIAVLVEGQLADEVPTDGEVKG